ncbi:MAG: ArsR/SmtB family transcription factor [Pikeienuella sp.]
MNSTNLSATFAALGDPTRFAIVERLLQDGELCAGALLDAAPISAPAISRHLKVLRKAGVVHQRIDAQRRLYSVRPEAVQTISAWTESHRDFWQASLDRLDALLTKEMSRK